MAQPIISSLLNIFPEFDNFDSDENPMFIRESENTYRFIAGNFLTGIGSFTFSDPEYDEVIQFFKRIKEYKEEIDIHISKINLLLGSSLVKEEIFYIPSETRRLVVRFFYRFEEVKEKLCSKIIVCDQEKNSNFGPTDIFVNHSDINLKKLKNEIAFSFI